MTIITQQTVHVPIEKVRQHPTNPRKGNVPAIRESIAENGFFGSVVVQRSTGYILAGNHRYEAALLEDAAVIPVAYADVDDEQALRILLADNRTNDVASYNDEGLAELLEHLASTDEGLAGTGYDEASMQELLYELGRDAPNFAPAGIDEQGQLDQKKKHTCPECGCQFE